MDFDALLAQHNSTQDTAGSLATTESALKGLSGELSTPRDGPERAERDRDRDRRQGRDRGRGREQRRQPYRQQQQRSEVVDEEDGAIKYSKVWGQYLRWNEEAWKSAEKGSVLVQFEARGEDNIVVALSGEPRVMSPMYEIVIGGWRDTKSVIRREAQGSERALSAQARLCSASDFHKYWVCQNDGLVSVGIGSIPGKGVIIAWRDPEPIPSQFVSFTTWDHTVTFRNIQVSQPQTGMEMDDVEMSNYVTDYMAKLDEERTRLKERASRFDTDYREPDSLKLASHVLDDVERARLKHDLQKQGGTGFITGFDPTTEEERKKAEDRAKRFGLDKKGEEEEKDDDDVMMSRERREARAQRFQIPVMEDKRIAEGILRDLASPSVPRRDPKQDESIREEAIHLYGNFDGVYTQGILDWFGFYGASHIEWLHDCGANVVFSDVMTAKRALLGLGKQIPDMDQVQAQVDDLRSKGYFYAPFPLGGEEVRFFLIRKASAGDVKATNPAYRTTKGYRPKIRARRGGHERRAIESIRRQASGEDSENLMNVGSRRKREDDENGEGNEESIEAAEVTPSKRTKRMDMDDDEDGDE